MWNNYVKQKKALGSEKSAGVRSDPSELNRRAKKNRSDVLDLQNGTLQKRYKLLITGVA
jgi:hypothetical protein